MKEMRMQKEQGAERSRPATGGMPENPALQHIAIKVTQKTGENFAVIGPAATQSEEIKLNITGQNVLHRRGDAQPYRQCHEHKKQTVAAAVTELDLDAQRQVARYRIEHCFFSKNEMVEEVQGRPATGRWTKTKLFRSPALQLAK